MCLIVCYCHFRYCVHHALTVTILVVSFVHLPINCFSFHFVIQLDICKEMAGICARTSTKHLVQLFDSFCLAHHHFPNSSGTHVGKRPYCSSGKEHNWFSYNNGGHCFASVILLYNALVENTMAKFKYVFRSLT
jgi:hypothetical protein